MNKLKPNNIQQTYDLAKSLFPYNDIFIDYDDKNKTKGDICVEGKYIATNDVITFAHLIGNAGFASIEPLQNDNIRLILSYGYMHIQPIVTSDVIKFIPDLFKTTLETYRKSQIKVDQELRDNLIQLCNHVNNIIETYPISYKELKITDGEIQFVFACKEGIVLNNGGMFISQDLIKFAETIEFNYGEDCNMDFVLTLSPNDFKIDYEVEEVFEALATGARNGVKLSPQRIKEFEYDKKNAEEYYSSDNIKVESKRDEAGCVISLTAKDFKFDNLNDFLETFKHSDTMEVNVLTNGDVNIRFDYLGFQESVSELSDDYKKHKLQLPENKMKRANFIIDYINNADPFGETQLTDVSITNEGLNIIIEKDINLSLDQRETFWPFLNMMQDFKTLSFINSGEDLLRIEITI